MKWKCILKNIYCDSQSATYSYFFEFWKNTWITHWEQILYWFRTMISITYFRLHHFYNTWYHNNHHLPILMVTCIFLKCIIYQLKLHCTFLLLFFNHQGEFGIKNHRFWCNCNLQMLYIQDYMSGLFCMHYWYFHIRNVMSKLLFSQILCS